MYLSFLETFKYQLLLIYFMKKGVLLVILLISVLFISACDQENNLFSTQKSPQFSQEDEFNMPMALPIPILPDKLLRGDCSSQSANHARCRPEAGSLEIICLGILSIVLNVVLRDSWRMIRSLHASLKELRSKLPSKR